MAEPYPRIMPECRVGGAGGGGGGRAKRGIHICWLQSNFDFNFFGILGSPFLATTDAGPWTRIVCALDHAQSAQMAASTDNCPVPPGD
jgi:hypothetical protein